MKNFLIATFALLGMTPLLAQDYQHHLDESLALAKAGEKNVLMIFSGSDWCKPCMQLRQSVLQDDDFLQFSQQHLVLLELDFPYRKKNQLPPAQQAHNDALAEKYNREGVFPKMLLLNADQEIIGTVPYRKNLSTDAFLQQLQSLIAKS